MKRELILRFRDLVTENGGTISEHKSILASYGKVWWGWWMRQYEIVPRDLFVEVSEDIERSGAMRAYLLNTGVGKMYSCRITDLRVAPPGSKIGPPESSITPEYYSRGQYPAWFLLSELKDVKFEDLELTFEWFPTRPDKDGVYRQLIGQNVSSIESLRDIDVTLWVVGSR